MNSLEISKILLDAGAVTLSPDKPYIFASGIKSPVYTDNRLLMSIPSSRKKIVKAYVDTIKKNSWNPDVIAGVATAGIPWAAWIADEMNKPMVFVRSNPKDHGKENLIEGKIKIGDKVVVIEDLISSGGSTLKVVSALKSANAVIEGCVAIFTYGMKKSKDAFEEEKVKLSCLTDFESFVDVAVSSNVLKKSQQEMVLSWAKDPDGWKR